MTTTVMGVLQVIQSLGALQGLTASVTSHVAYSRTVHSERESDVSVTAAVLQHGMAASDATGWSTQLRHRFPVSILQRALSFLADSSNSLVHSSTVSISAGSN